MVALFTVELNFSSFPPTPATLEGTRPLTALPAFEPRLFAPVAADPTFVALAIMARRFLPREATPRLPPLAACVEWSVCVVRWKENQ